VGSVPLSVNAALVNDGVRNIQAADLTHEGVGYVSVSSMGLSTPGVTMPNSGADFGPDTSLNGGPGSYGPPYTTTGGQAEANTYLTKHGGGLALLVDGQSKVIVPTAGNAFTTPYLLGQASVVAEWSAITGGPEVTVSSIGLSSPGVIYANNGSNFGPDTTGTTTFGMYEATQSVYLGGTVRVLPGNYLFAPGAGNPAVALTNLTGVKVVFDPGSVLEWPTGIAGRLFVVNNCTDLFVEGGYFLSNDPVSSGRIVVGALVGANNANVQFVRNVWDSFSKYAVTAKGSTTLAEGGPIVGAQSGNVDGVWVDSNRFLNIGSTTLGDGACVAFYNATTAGAGTVTGLQVVDCEAPTVNFYGVDIGNAGATGACSGVKVFGGFYTLVTGAAASGVFVEHQYDNTDVTVLGVTMTGFQAGVHFYGSGKYIVDNHIVSPNWKGINVDQQAGMAFATEFCTLIGNHIEGANTSAHTDGAGIYLNNVTGGAGINDIAISDNIITGGLHGAYAYYIDNANLVDLISNVYIRGGDINGNPGGILGLLNSWPTGIDPTSFLISEVAGYKPAWYAEQNPAFVTVTPNGGPLGDGGNFGPNTPGTTTNGWLEAYTAASVSSAKTVEILGNFTQTVSTALTAVHSGITTVFRGGTITDGGTANGLITLAANTNQMVFTGDATFVGAGGAGAQPFLKMTNTLYITVDMTCTYSGFTGTNTAFLYHLGTSAYGLVTMGQFVTADSKFLLDTSLGGLDIANFYTASGGFTADAGTTVFIKGSAAGNNVYRVRVHDFEIDGGGKAVGSGAATMNISNQNSSYTINDVKIWGGTIRNLGTGAFAGNQYRDGIDLGYVNDCVVSDIIMDHVGDGVASANSNRHIYTAVNVTNSRFFAIQIGDPTNQTGTSTDYTISACTAQACGQYNAASGGFGVVTGTGGSITTVIFNGCTATDVGSVQAYGLKIWNSGSTGGIADVRVDGGRLQGYVGALLFLNANNANTMTGISFFNVDGVDPAGVIVLPFTASPQSSVGLCYQLWSGGAAVVPTAQPVASTVYTVCGYPVYVTSTGGAATITINDAGGNAIPTAGTLFRQRLEVGYTISWSTVVAVTVTVEGA